MVLIIVELIRYLCYGGQSFLFYCISIISTFLDVGASSAISSAVYDVWTVWADLCNAYVFSATTTGMYYIFYVTAMFEKN